MDIYIVRHGQTDWNLLKRMQGIEDIPLNDTGREQALVCARALSGLPFETIYTSPLSRAAETAQIISDYECHAPVILKQELIERDFGKGSGMTYTAFHTQYADYPRILPEGMEPFDVFSKRVISAVLSCTEMHHKKPILLVSHGAFINALLYQTSGGSCGTGITELKNTCISRLFFDNTTESLSLDFYNLSPAEFSCSAC